MRRNDNGLFCFSYHSILFQSYCDDCYCCVVGLRMIFFLVDSIEKYVIINDFL